MRCEGVKIQVLVIEVICVFKGDEDSIIVKIMLSHLSFL